MDCYRDSFYLTHFVFIIKTSWLRMFEETVAVFSENDKKYINSLCR
jgi:hypothetical protein